MRIEIIYDRAALIGRTLKTVMTNLIEGGVLVIVVLLFMLGSLRAGIDRGPGDSAVDDVRHQSDDVFGITASLMSLGAIDFGLIVDSSVIMVENCMHRLAHRPDGQITLASDSRRGDRSSQADDVWRADHRASSTCRS